MKINWEGSSIKSSGHDITFQRQIKWVSFWCLRDISKQDMRRKTKHWKSGGNLKITIDKEACKKQKDLSGFHKSSSEVSEKFGHSMEEKWQTRHWHTEITLCEQKYFMDAGGRYDAEAKRRLQYSVWVKLCYFLHFTSVRYHRFISR